MQTEGSMMDEICQRDFVFQQEEMIDLWLTKETDQDKAKPKSNFCIADLMWGDNYSNIKYKIK